MALRHKTQGLSVQFPASRKIQEANSDIVSFTNKKLLLSAADCSWSRCALMVLCGYEELELCPNMERQVEKLGSVRPYPHSARALTAPGPTGISAGERYLKLTKF